MTPLRIGRDHYSAAPRIDGSVGVAKPGRDRAARYSVARDASGRVTCTCPHFRIRLADDPAAGPCKHGAAVEAAGLLK